MFVGKSLKHSLHCVIKGKRLCNHKFEADVVLDEVPDSRKICNDCILTLLRFNTYGEFKTPYDYNESELTRKKEKSIHTIKRDKQFLNILIPQIIKKLES